MTRPSAAILVLFLAALALSMAAVPVAAGPEIEYLYIDASEGGGSGGHAALALGGRVFHFEYRAPGILRLAREPVDAVLHRYGVLANRSIGVSRIPVSADTYGLVLDELTRRYFVQRQHFADYEAAVSDRQLLEAVRDLRHGRAAEAPLALDGAGLFFVGDPTGRGAQGFVGDPTGRGAKGSAPALVRLRERVVAAYGEDVLARATARVREELTQLRPDADGDLGAEVSPLPALAEDRFAPGRYGLAERYRDALLTLLALEVLDSAPPLRPGSLVSVEGPGLAPGEAPVVARLADLLEASLGRLVQSRRPDRGGPLLLGMARLIALDETRRSERWTVVGAAAEDVGAIRREGGARPALARDLRDRAAAGFGSAQAALLGRAADAEAFPELELAEVEAAAHRLAEVERALAARGEEGMAREVPAPGRGVRPPAPALSTVGDGDLQRAVAAAKAREAAQLGALVRLYGYNLFTRNCVTEIFRTIEAALRRDVLAREPGLEGAALSARVRGASVARLGGYVEPGAGMSFIPAASASAVEGGYAVSEVVELPSYRKVELGRMYDRGNPLWVFLRESNTLSSTLYRRTHDDSAFLFFTDTAPAARPVFGALNVIAGLGTAAAGLAVLPIDGGELLTAGLKGAMFSLPELAFFNIRKGSFPDVAGR